MDDTTMKEMVAQAVAAAMAAAASAGAATARTSENTEHSDRTRATTRDSADRSRTDWFTANQVDSDVQATEAMQKQTVGDEGKNRSWFDLHMGQIHRHIEDLHHETMNMRLMVRRDLGDSWGDHRTTRMKGFVNLFSQVDELEVLAAKIAEALAPIIVANARSA